MRKLPHGNICTLALLVSILFSVILLVFRFYLDTNLVIGDTSTTIKDSTLELQALELRFFGGSVIEDLDDDVSHVLLDKK